MSRLANAMWGSLALIAWTHVGYPAAAAVAGSLSRYRPRADDAYLPAVTLVIAAHDEERVIRDRLENALVLDYPRELLEVVVSLDGSTDGTSRIAAAYAQHGVSVIENPRRGKVTAQNAAVRATSSEIVAFSDANSMWEPAALRRLVRHFADPEVGYVCGRLQLVEPGTGRNVEGRYWRYELWLRAQESRLGSITAGNGAIYAVRRTAYRELSPGQSHDIGLPFRLRRGGLRSLYEPDAVATEPVAPTSAAEWERKVRMLSRSWNDVLFGGMLDPRGLPSRYILALVSHRLLRYATGPLHVVVLFAALLLAATTRGGRGVVAVHMTWFGLALAACRNPGRSKLADFALYYLIVTAASLAGLVRLAVRGPQVTWTPVDGTR